MVGCLNYSTIKTILRLGLTQNEWSRKIGFAPYVEYCLAKLKKERELREPSKLRLLIPYG